MKVRDVSGFSSFPVNSRLVLEAGFLHATKTRAEDLNTPECTAIPSA